MRFARVLALLVPVMAAALFCAAPAPRAEAAQPEFVILDDTFVDPALSEACGFDVEIHIHLLLIARPSAGRDVTHSTITFTRLDTGAQVESRSDGANIFSIDLETGFVQITSSRALRIVVPGTGAAYVAAGHTVETFVFDPETGDLISHELVEHGRHRDVDLLEVICELLEE